MKNLFKKTMLLAAAAMAFAQCSTDTTEDVISTSGVSVSIEASTSDITRSAFGDYNATDKTYPTLWEGNESWKICVNDVYADLENKAIEFAGDKRTARADVSLSSEPEAYNGTYTLHAVSPLSAFVSVNMTSDYLRYRIPAGQTPTATSCDPAAQVLIAQSEAKETMGSFNIAFKHAVAYIKFSFLNVAEGGNVSGISIKSNGINLAGRYIYKPSTGDISYLDGGQSEINLVTTSTTDLWVACAPAATKDKTLTFSIITDKGTLSKDVKMPGDLEIGKVKTFNVDMADIEYPAADVTKYVKVTSLADITSGEYVIVHEVNGTCVLPNTKATAKSPVTQIQLSTKATIGDGVLTNVSDDVKWVLTGSTAAMKFQSYADEANILYTTSDNNGLRISNSTDGNGVTWTIAALKSGFSIKDSKNNRYCGVYTPGTDWRTYTSATQSNYGSNGASLTFYKKTTGGSEGGDTPELSVTPATVEVAATGGNGEFGYTVANMDDDITASTTTEWITGVSASNGKVTYSVAANYSGTARSGNIVLTSASADISKTVAVSQAADVFEVSVTEISLGADSGATAKFTVKSTYAFTLTSPDDDKIGLSTDSGQGELEITVTALTSNGSSGELSRGNIRITRSGDNKTKEVTVKQKAAGAAEPILETAEVAGTTGTKSSNGNSISWDSENFTITNVKGSTAIRTSDSDHYRAYAGSTLTFTAKNGKKFTKIVITCTGSSYATEMQKALGDAATASGSTVTWTGSATTVSGTLTAQSRFNKVVATLE